MSIPADAEHVTYQIRVQPSSPQDNTLLGLHLDVDLAADGPVITGTLRLEYGDLTQRHDLLRAMADAARSYMASVGAEFSLPAEASRTYSGTVHPEGDPWPAL